MKPERIEELMRQIPGDDCTDAELGEFDGLASLLLTSKRGEQSRIDFGVGHPDSLAETEAALAKAKE